MKRRVEEGVLRALTDLGSGIAKPLLSEVSAVQLARQIDPTAADYVIVTALKDELEAVLKAFPNLEKVVVGSSSRTYYQGVVQARDGTSNYRVAVSLLRGMGNVEAATGTADVIRDWNPRYVVMCGIAGGLQKGEQQLGDIVVATDVVYYELGKLRKTGLERRPISYRCDQLLVERAMHLDLGESWRAQLPQRPVGGRSVGLPTIHFGPVASGEKVIASEDDALALLRLHPKMLAVEMEGGGVAASALSAAGQVGFLMIRSICDFADAAKGDDWRSYAAGAAASFLSELIRSRAVAPAEGIWQGATPEASQDLSPAWVRDVFFPKLCKTLNMEEFVDLCFLLMIDVEDLPGSTKRGKIRELLSRAERRGRLAEIVSAYEKVLEDTT